MSIDGKILTPLANLRKNLVKYLTGHSNLRRPSHVLQIRKAQPCISQSIDINCITSIHESKTIARTLYPTPRKSLRAMASHLLSPQANRKQFPVWETLP